MSDRIDKEDADSAIVLALERKREAVCGDDGWFEKLNISVREDLRRHRSYNGKSVRDLLRGLRNKKHHYNELSTTVKNLYGRVPDQFCDYWTSRFPNLLISTWQAMHCIKNEEHFVKYYDMQFDFLEVKHIFIF